MRENAVSQRQYFANLTTLTELKSRSKDSQKLIPNKNSLVSDICENCIIYDLP